MRGAHELGCPVAPVRWIEPTGDVLGQPFFVMDYLDGAAERSQRPLDGSRAGRGLRRAVSTTCTAPTGRTTLESTSTVGRRDPAADRALVSTSTARRPTSRSRCWRRARPGCTITLLALEQVGIVHGDPGPGNFVHDGRRVSSPSPIGSSPTSATRSRTGPTWCTMRGARTMVQRRMAGVVRAGRRGDRDRPRPALLERVQLLQGRLRQPDLSARVPHGQSGPRTWR